MGRPDLPFALGKDQALRFPPQLLIAVSDGYLDALRPELAAAERGTLSLLPVPPAGEIPPEALSRANCLIIEVDPSLPETLDRLSGIRRGHPSLPVIAALADANVSLVRSLVRQGVTDVVALPFDTEEMLQACVSAVEASMDASSAPSGLAPVIAVVRSIGGIGASTLAVHLADAVGRDSSEGRGACLIDLDVQQGSISQLLGLAPRRTLEDLLAAGSRLDSSFLRSVVVAHSKHLHVVAAPEEIAPLESTDTDQLLRVVDCARAEYDCVILDLPANWTSWNLSAVLGADLVLMVVSLDIASLRQAKRQIALFQEAGLDRSKIGIVVNKVEKRLFRLIGLDDVAETLKVPVIGALPMAPQVLSAARDQGLLANQLHKKGPFINEIAKLAENLSGRFGLVEN